MPFFDLHTKQYQIIAFRYLLSLSAFAGLLFFVVNMLRARYLLSFSELCISLVALFFLVALIKGKLNRYLNLACLIYLFFLYSLMTCMLAFVVNMQATMYSIIFFIPPLSYLLLGNRMGFIYTCIFAPLAMMIYLLRFSSTGYGLNISIISNLVTCLFAVWLFSYLYEKAQDDSQKALIKKASKDSLTRLFSRASVDFVLSRDKKRSLKQKNSLSVAVLDIDWFKIVNDNYGYHIGDRVLIEIAEIIQKNIRHSDSAFRLGGEEFCISFPSTMPRHAAQIVEKIRMEVEQKVFKFEDYVFSLSISAGITDCVNIQLPSSDLLKAADKQMHIAKQQGRNQVAIHHA